MKHALTCVTLGSIKYGEAREFQQRLLQERLDSRCSDTIIFCEHPPVMTLGKRTAPGAVNQSDPYWRGLATEFVEVERGGEATFHGPGQLVVYPVISLRERGWGVRRFVTLGLEALADAVRGYGLEAAAKECPAGVWVGPEKIGFAGLRIRSGITDHGFALNANCDLEPYRHFISCGVEAPVTSLEQKLKRKISMDDLRQAAWEKFSAKF